VDQLVSLAAEFGITIAQGVAGAIPTGHSPQSDSPGSQISE
jgi:hypothetical protein